MSVRALGTALLSAMGAFLFGLDIGYIAPVLECDSFKRDVAHIDPREEISELEQGFIVSVFSLGAVVTSFPAIGGLVMDARGRRDTIVLGTALFLAGGFIQAGSWNVPVMCVGRFVSGLAIGLLSAAVALYQSEVAPSHLRGAMTSLYQLLITFGIVCSTLVNKQLVGMDDGWRWARLLQVIPAGVLLVGMPTMPRSPRWLMMKGRAAEAREALVALRQGEAQCSQEYEEMSASCAEAKSLGEPQWHEFFTGRIRNLLCLGVALQMLQQMVGMNAFMYFGPSIYGKAGMNPDLVHTFATMTNFLATIPAIFLVDRMGRKRLLLAGGLGMMSATVIMGTCGLFNAAPNLMVVSVFLFVACFAVSWGPVVWIYCAEIFPLKYRSWAMALTTCGNWCFNGVIAQVTPALLENFGSNTFYIFAGFCLLAVALAAWIPETKGVALERISLLFDSKFSGASESKGVELTDLHKASATTGLVEQGIVYDISHRRGP